MNTDFIARCIAGEALDGTTADSAALTTIIDAGQKNVLYFDSIGAFSGNGAGNVSATLNNGIITLSGYTTEVGTAYAYLQISGSTTDYKNFCNGEYVLSGCPVNNNGVTLRLMGTDYTSTIDNGNGAVINAYTGSNIIRCAIYIAANSNVDDVVISPMICLKSFWDISQTYQPYREYTTINGVRVYVSATAPTGDNIPDGSIGIGW